MKKEKVKLSEEAIKELRRVKREYPAVKHLTLEELANSIICTQAKCYAWKYDSWDESY